MCTHSSRNYRFLGARARASLKNMGHTCEHCSRVKICFRDVCRNRSRRGASVKARGKSIPGVKRRCTFEHSSDFMRGQNRFVWVRIHGYMCVCFPDSPGYWLASRKPYCTSFYYAVVDSNNLLCMSPYVSPEPLRDSSQCSQFRFRM